MVETRFEESAPTSIDPFAPIRIAEGYDLGKASQDRVSHVHAVADIAQHEVDYLTSHKIYTGELSQMRHEIDVAGSVMVQELISLIDGARDTFGLPKTSKP